MDRISNASEDDVRKTLAALCEDPFVHIRAVEILEKLERDRQRRAADLSTTTPDTATKRKADPDVHICIQCEKAFTESGNAPDACLYHPGAHYLTHHYRTSSTDGRQATWSRVRSSWMIFTIIFRLQALRKCLRNFRRRWTGSAARRMGRPRAAKGTGTALIHRRRPGERQRTA